ncbi:MAG: hypothetical protein DMF56_27785 [Acidobacteria bacterium]|nr:MAG: hypothetical protein DMF56_27785 [Acidobacteriota bacterium]
MTTVTDYGETSIDVGALWRSKHAIIKLADDDQSRLCRVVAVVPDHRRRQPHVPEYKVELLAAPVTAFRQATDLEVLASRKSQP